MALEPEVGAVLRLEGQDYAFVGVPRSPQIVYAEPGRKAKVYRLRQLTSGRIAALKVFFPQFRGPQHDLDRVERSDRLKRAVVARYPAGLERERAGLVVADRTVITPERNAETIRRYPAFAYSILMDWAEGESWANYVIGRVAVTRENCLSLGRTFARTIAGLEAHTLAHCDLAAGNFVFREFVHVNLVDLEDLFAKELSAPQPMPAGTGGYVPEWVAAHGLWGAGADRIAGAILLCEILCWHFADIRQARDDASFFAPGEIGHPSKRYRLMRARLGEMQAGLPELFERVWNARRLEDCPSFEDWSAALQEEPSPSPDRRCSQCGERTQPSWKRCPHCGNWLITPPPDVLPEPSGLAVLHVNTDDLRFALAPDQPAQATLEITNTGPGRLIGTISHEPWLQPSTTHLNLAPTQRLELIVTLLVNHPAVAPGESYMFPRGLIIQTNGGERAVGGQITRPRRGWRSLLGM